ncbi:MAG: PEP-CTERM sorting domain-containing protein [Phycisphaerae bacterium]|nr:PEP-CTERM sorting domain-containing protein [Phycisphaerae bacterium]
MAADETANWLGGDGYWTDPAMWSTANYPNNDGLTYDVVIDNNIGSPYRVSVSNDVTIDNLLINSEDATLHMNNSSADLCVTGEFRIDHGIVNLGKGTVTNSTISGAGGTFIIWYDYNQYPSVFDSVTLKRGIVFDTSYSKASLHVRNGMTLDGGVIRLNGVSDHSAVVAFDGTQILSGVGEIISDHEGCLGDSGLVFGDQQLGGKLTIGPSIVVKNGTGSMKIRGGRTDSDPDVLVNQGLISASKTIYVDGYEIQNEGKMEALTDGALSVRNLTNYGEIIAPPGSKLQLLDNMNNYGTINADNAKVSVAVQPGIIGDFQLKDSTLDFRGILAYGPSKSPRITSAQLQSFDLTNCIVEIGGSSSYSVTVDNEGGTIILDSNKGQYYLGEKGKIVGGTIDSVADETLWVKPINTYPATTYLDSVTLNANVDISNRTTMEGTGIKNHKQLTVNGPYAYLNLYGEWNNYGTIQLNDSNLYIGNRPQESLGTIVANDSMISFQGNFTTSELDAISRTNTPISIGGVLDNRGSSITIGDTQGTWTLWESGRIIGGVIQGDAEESLWNYNNGGTLENVTLAVNLDINNRTSLFVENGIELNGSTIVLQGYTYGYPFHDFESPSILGFRGSQIVHGNGEVVFGGSGGGNYIQPIQGSLIIGDGITIRTGEGSGTIGNESNSIINYGSVLAETNGKNITITGDMFMNYGTITVNNGGRIGIDPNTNFNNHGTIAVGFGGFETYDLCIGQTGGGFQITDPGASVIVSHKLRLEDGGVFSAVVGSTIHMTGSAFENTSTDPAALADLINLTLVFEGGTADIDTFEIAGEDFGAVMDGYDLNFALGTLQLGGEAGIGQVQLVDLFDNQTDWVGTEVLYVENLIIGAGSTLDLNGYTLYYLNADIDPSATILYGEGGGLVQAPEPATLGLLALGGLGLLKRKRR